MFQSTQPKLQSANPGLSELARRCQRPVADDLNRIRQEREQQKLPVLDFNQGLIRPPRGWSTRVRTWFREGTKQVLPWSMSRVAGSDSLRQAIAEWRQVLWKEKIGPDNVLITLGANAAWNAVMRTVSNVGDNIAVTRPYFFNHAGAIHNSGRQMAYVDLQFDKEVSSLRANHRAPLALARTSAILLSNPNNPIGVQWPREVLNEIEESCRKLKKWLVIDESYGALKLADSLLVESGEAFDLRSTIAIGSFSKSLALGDLRLGYVIARKDLVEALTSFTDHDYICASQIVQFVAHKAVENRILIQQKISDDLSVKRRYIEKLVSRYPRLELHRGGNAVFAWLKLPEGVNDILLTQLLASRNGILMTPGSAYGATGCIRLAYGMCANLQDIDLAFESIDKFLESATGPLSLPVRPV